MYIHSDFSDIRRAYEIENKDLNLGHGGLHKGYFMRSVFSTVQGSKNNTKFIRMSYLEAA